MQTPHRHPDTGERRSPPWHGLGPAAILTILGLLVLTVLWWWPLMVVSFHYWFGGAPW